jgi:DNA-binding LacI/PurR family transcriptional regulator
LVLSSLKSFITFRAINGIEQVANENGYSVIIAYLMTLSTKYFEMLASGIDGFIMSLSKNTIKAIFTT